MNKYTMPELDQHAIEDILRDAEFAEKQAKEGPFYPERDIVPETLLAYAKLCRETVLKYKSGGLHDALMKGEA